MTTCSDCDYSVLVQTMSVDKLSDMNNNNRQAEIQLDLMKALMEANPKCLLAGNYPPICF